jgi:hypothetical protein
MSKESKANDLLNYFNVGNHQELMEYIRDNPDDIKVMELKELLTLCGIDLDSEVDKDE